MVVRRLRLNKRKKQTTNFFTFFFNAISILNRRRNAKTEKGTKRKKKKFQPNPSFLLTSLPPDLSSGTNAMDAMGGRKLEAMEASPSTYVPHPQQNFIKKKPK